MRGEDRRRQNGGLDSGGRDDGKRYGQRAFADAGNIVNGKKSFLHNMPLFLDGMVGFPL